MVGRERSNSSRLVGFHETAIANHIGGKNGCEVAFHCCSPRRREISASRYENLCGKGLL